jgi:predicted MPP superfamily phosphohydrolase
MKHRFTLLFLLSTVILIGIYCVFIEPNLLHITYWDIGEAQSRETAKVVYFADLHIYSWRPFHDRALRKIAELQPDCIFFGGDALSKQTNIEALERFFEKLSGIAPVYAIFGNWENEAPIHMYQRYENLGIHLIEKDTEIIEIRGVKIGITGVQSHYFFQQAKNTERLTEADWKILLVHAPNRLEEYPSFLSAYDLILSAHTHGGQFYIPGITPLIMQWSGNGSRYLRGQYEIGDTVLYVTRGIGQWFPGRLFSVPEIVIFELPVKKEVF